jgi:succinate dehydrogenase/fumarate reductase-like Fe-S protein
VIDLEEVAKMTKEEKKVRIYLMGREFEVPANLNVVKAFEYAGYRFVRGIGCRGGYCGACATVYRFKDDYRLQFALACQKAVEDGMYLTILPFVPAEKAKYDLSKLKPRGTVLLELYPEIARCVCCNTCTKACPQELEVMEYVQAAVRGDIEACANLSFDCIQCGLCAMRCPAEIVPYNVAQLARRLYGKYIEPAAKPTAKRVEEINACTFDEELETLTHADIEEVKRRYKALIGTSSE